MSFGVSGLWDAVMYMDFDFGLYEFRSVLMWIPLAFGARKIPAQKTHACAHKFQSAFPPEQVLETNFLA